TPPLPIPGGVSCPLSQGTHRISTWSLGTDDGSAKSEHGSSSYWGATGVCSYTIPYIAKADGGLCKSSGDAACAPNSDVSGNVCYRLGTGPRQSYYGYAIDVVGSDQTVYLPKIGGVAEWIVSSRFSIFNATRGYGVIIDGTDLTTNPPIPYKLYLA